MPPKVAAAMSNPEPLPWTSRTVLYARSKICLSSSGISKSSLRAFITQTVLAEEEPNPKVLLNPACVVIEKPRAVGCFSTKFAIASSTNFAPLGIYPVPSWLKSFL